MHMSGTWGGTTARTGICWRPTGWKAALQKRTGGEGGLLVDTKLNVSRQRGLAAKAAKDILSPIERKAGVIYATIQLCSPIKLLAIPGDAGHHRPPLGSFGGAAYFSKSLLPSSAQSLSRSALRPSSHQC